MDQDLWEKVEDLFHAALDCPAEARQQFLEQACDGNVELCHHVEELLAKHTEANSFLEEPLLENIPVASSDAPEIEADRFGSYRVTSRLGAGGMGEVYHGRDKKLGRDVAIKTLPYQFAQDPSRLARFRREARTLASLNHPNIAAIYGFEESGKLEFLVMELVEGEMLRGPLPLERALEYAHQIAQGLEAAHERGIIHRDLKPANVKVTTRGQIKILDFGLAKAIWGSEVKQDLSETVSQAGPDTLAGHVIGTPGYMSPEQALGRAVDNRTDIWAFGCLLYELLTGKRAFNGDTINETVAAVLQREPDWHLLPRRIPASVRTLLRACLQKDANRRPQSIADVRRAIEQAQQRQSRKRVKVAIGFSVLAITAAAIWVVQSRPAGMHTPVMTRITTDSGLTEYPALSPDGKLLAYASDRGDKGNLEIWIEQLGEGGKSLQLTRSTVDNSEPSFSPDGSRIVFRSERDGGGVYTIATFGGNEQWLAAWGRRPRFSPDGKWIAYWVGDQSYFGRRRIFVIPASGGQPLQFQPSFHFASHPVWSPDSKHLLFRGAREIKDTEAARFDWWIAPFEGGEAVPTGAQKVLSVTRLPAVERSQIAGGFAVEPGEWTPDFIIFTASSGMRGLNASLWRAPISWSYRVHAPVERLTSGTENMVQPSAAGSRIAFASIGQNENIWSVPIDGNGGKVTGGLQRLTSSSASDIMPVVSANGQTIAFASNRMGNMHVWIKDLKEGVERQLTSAGDTQLPWLVTKDGSQVVSCAFGFENKGQGCFLVPMNGGPAQRFCPDCGSLIQDWFDNGRKFLFKKGLASAVQLIVRDVSSGTESVFLRSVRPLAAARISPDNRWMSFQVVIDPATRRQIFVTPIRSGAAAGEGEWISITDGSGLDRNAVWSPDGNLLYFLSERDGYRCIWAQRLASENKHPVGAPFAVYHFHTARHSLMPAQEVSRISLSVTQKRLIFSMAEATGNIWLADFQ